MGPRPDGRGRPQPRLHRRPCRDASMGPRPDGRGRYRQRAPYQPVNRASMGPRPDGRGRRGRGGGAAQLLLRQWGRGRMAAEGPCPFIPLIGLICVNGAAAGWPRKGGGGGGDAFASFGVNGAAAGWPRKAARAARPGRSLLASMGPRPDGRGRMKTGGRPLGGRLRQWGRGRMAAEGGAAQPRRDGRRAASMGPRPDGRGRRQGHSKTTKGLPRQWGRGRMAAEGLAASLVGAAVLWASMGPRPDGRGRT